MCVCVCIQKHIQKRTRLTPKQDVVPREPSTSLFKVCHTVLFRSYGTLYFNLYLPEFRNSAQLKTRTHLRLKASFLCKISVSLGFVRRVLISRILLRT